MSKFFKILTGVISLFMGLILIAFALLLNLDFNEYRKDISAQVTKATGRSFSINGNLDVDFSLVPTIKASGIVMGNAQWSANPHMLKVETAAIEVGLLSLIFHPIDIHDISMSGVDILLETAPSGLKNYQFLNTKLKENTSESPQEKIRKITEEIGDGDLLPILRQVALDDINITFLNGINGAEQTLNIQEITLLGDVPTEAMQLSIQATSGEGVSANLNGILGSPEAMLDPKMPWDVDIFGNLAGFAINVKGTINDPTLGAGVDLNLALDGAELSNVAKLFLVDIPAIGKFRMDVKMNGDVGKNIRLDDLIVEVGTIDILLLHARGQIENLDKLSGVDLDIELKSNELGNLSPFVEKFGGKAMPNFGPLRFKSSVKGGLATRLALQDIDVELGQPNLIKLGATGAIADLYNQEGIAVDIDTKIANLANFSKFVGQALPAIGPLEIQASIAGDKSENLDITNLVARVGKSDISGHLSYNATSKNPAVNATFRSGLIRKSDFILNADDAAANNGNLSAIASNPSATGQYLISEKPVDFSFLKMADGDFDIQITNLKANGATLQNARLKAGLVGGKLDVDKLQFSDQQGNLVKLNLILDSAKSPPTISAVLNADKFEIAELVMLAGLPNIISGPLDIDVAMKAHGKNPHQLAANLNGRANLFLQDGLIYRQKIRKRYANDAAPLVDLLLGGINEGGQDVVHCIVFDYNIKDGLVMTNSSVLDTQTTTVTSSGNVNLATEKIDLTVTPHRTVIGLPATLPVLVGGTFKSPNFLPNPLGTVLNLTKSLLGDAANIITLGDVGEGLFDENSPCVHLRPSAQKKNQSNQQQLQQDLKDQPEKIIKNLLKGIFQN